MQSTTRYISVQLGIGGWQTMKAYDVALSGYGDCKALSNYMIALLKVVGIKANQVLVNAGKTNYIIQPDFPFFEFNHAIACVPLYKDTLWLECTSQTNSAGYLGSFTGNRKALVINEDGGTLINTITYTPSNNVQKRKAVVTINANGNATATVKTFYKALKQEPISSILNYSDKEHQKEIITRNINIPNFELTNFSLKEIKSDLPVIEENLELKINRIVAKTGSIIFLTPNILPEPLYIPVSAKERASPFYLDPNYFSYSTTDTIIYNLPKEFTVESLPTSSIVKSEFGEYICTFTFKDNQLIYYRNLIFNGGTFAGAQYKDWISFARQVNKNDKLKVLFTATK